MGHFLRELVIPTSALYFTGEATEEEEEDDDEGEEAHEEGEGEDEENNPGCDSGRVKTQQSGFTCSETGGLPSALLQRMSFHYLTKAYFKFSVVCLLVLVISA